jgi:4-amino-4-deoxy-L-arabinose transferase-like glycosyltransferase
MLFFAKRIKIDESLQFLFPILLGVFVIIRCIYFFLPDVVAWDASVYIGMGRFISSMGSTGVWEFFRPPFLPLLFSLGGLLHIDTILWAQLLTLSASVGSLALVYIIGERLRVRTGIWALVCLGISPLLLMFAAIPMTESFGVFFSLCVLELFLSKKNKIWLGLFVGILFLLRFPYGLLFPLIGLALLYTEYQGSAPLKRMVLKALGYGVGFSILVVPYLLLNKVLYGGFFLPFTIGQSMIQGFTWLYAHSGDFYWHILFVETPVFLLAIYALVVVRKKDFSREQKGTIALLVMWILFVSLYFGLQQHKEARYILPVFPPLALLAGIGFSYLFEKVHMVNACALCVFLILATLGHLPQAPMSKNESVELSKFYSYLSPYRGEIVISASPVVTAYTGVSIIPAYNSWEEFGTVYSHERQGADFLLINSCELHVCMPGNEKQCKEVEDQVLSTIERTDTVIYDSTTQRQCHLVIAKINK